MDAPQVIVETHISPGLPGFSLVGLPEAAVRESRERVRSAIINSGFEYPVRRITVNLAPADMPKRGGRHDLAIAVGILAASGQLADAKTDGIEFVAELALSGQLRAVPGAIVAVQASQSSGRAIVLSHVNRHEAQVIRKNKAFCAQTLLEVCQAILEPDSIKGVDYCALKPKLSSYDFDLSDVQGQKLGCRALELSAAGGHNLLFSGPPGTGKTLLAERLPGILPPLTESAMLAVASIYSVAGVPVCQDLSPPWRAPHHSISTAALIGGGRRPHPGEISLAHSGVLFLDEFAEFRKEALESLRQPLESGSVLVSRADYRSYFPAQFQLIAAMNPCPCGFWGDSQKPCGCTDRIIRRYRSKISGPLLDRFDLFVELARPSQEEWSTELASTSSEVRGRVVEARGRCRIAAGINALATVAELKTGLGMSSAAEGLLERATEKLRLSLRARARTLKLARTIADFVGAQPIDVDHIAEALSYRATDTQRFNV